MLFVVHGRTDVTLYFSNEAYITFYVLYVERFIFQTRPTLLRTTTSSSREIYLFLLLSQGQTAVKSSNLLDVNVVEEEGETIEGAGDSKGEGESSDGSTGVDD